MEPELCVAERTAALDQPAQRSGVLITSLSNDCISHKADAGT